MIKSPILFMLFQVLVLDLVDAQNENQSDCITPYGVGGLCIGLRQCPNLLRILQTPPLKSEAIEFLKQSQCGFDGNEPRVCCPIQSDSSNNDEANDSNLRFDLSNNTLLPSDCGRDLSERIFGGERTELDEFPWVTLLIYNKPNGQTAACGGVLISQRYVLTAAHCVKGKDIPKSWRLQSVRLGEYDTTTDPDCIKEDENSVFCADKVITVGIEQQLAHENYDPLSRDQKYDIALLRLDRDVPFTNYIKPICLPPNTNMGQKLFVSGWGKTEKESSSNIKLKVSLPLADNAQCKQRYSSLRVVLGYGQICAGGRKGKDSCRGDSGGPLMTVERASDGTGRWIVVGVVSFGPSPCGIQNWPGVYTRVIDFVPWILNNIKA